MKKIILAGLTLTAAFGITGCEAPGSATRTVTYEVSGSAAKVDLTYQNGAGSTQQESDVSLPWSKQITVKDMDMAYISAQNKGESGDVTTKILVDGSELKTATSSGAFTIATVDWMCCKTD